MESLVACLILTVAVFSLPSTLVLEEILSLEERLAGLDLGELMRQSCT